MDATDHHGGWPHLPHDLLAEVAARLLEADPFSVQVQCLHLASCRSASAQRCAPAGR